VASKDPNDVGTYKIFVRGSVPNGKPVFSDYLQIYLDVENGCLLDKVTASEPAIENLIY